VDGRASRRTASRRRDDRRASAQAVSLDVRTTPEADHHVRAIDEWWRTDRTAAPDQFLDELEAALALIGSAPNVGHPYRRSARPRHPPGPPGAQSLSRLLRAARRRGSRCGGLAREPRKRPTTSAQVNTLGPPWRWPSGVLQALDRATQPVRRFLGSSHLQFTWAMWPRMLVSHEARQPHSTGT
jgi:hypothetical protein